MNYKRFISGIILTIAVLVTSGCGYNRMQSNDERVKSAWSEVLNQYKRREDLIPNLVAVVARYAAHESDVFKGVAEARSSVGKITVTPELLNNPDAMKQFTAKQGDFTTALSKLMMVTENYPNLKADQQFLDLQRQLKTVEDGIAYRRKQYISAIQQNNTFMRQFPYNITAMIFGYKIREQFSVENEKTISNAPRVDFGKR